MPQLNDLSRSLVALDQDSTIIAVVELSQSSWLVAGVLPGIERQPQKKLEPSAERLLSLLHRWRDEAVRAGKKITRIALAFEAGRDGFWLARWLNVTKSRASDDPVIRWGNFLGCFSGARLDELVTAAAADVQLIDGHWCLKIRLDNRHEDATVKNEGSIRDAPLHQKGIIDDGFLDYVSSLPKDGPLFPTLPLDQFGKRSHKGGKVLMKFLRKECGITDKLQTFHSWRHTFKTAARDAGIAKD